MVRFVWLSLVPWLLSIVAQAQQPLDLAEQAGSSYEEKFQSAEPGIPAFGKGRLIEYVCGESCLIVAAPHGGQAAPHDYPPRSADDGVLVSDSRTDRLARAIRDELTAIANPSPHLVICHLHRKYMDANRPLEAACAEDSPAVQQWHEYQGAIRAAKANVVQQHRRGLFIEIHGHGHAQPRLELGYLLRSRDFEMPHNEFLTFKSRSSVREIAERGHVDLEVLIRGPVSLGAFLEAEGIPAIPSPDQPKIGRDPYFNGGWNTLQHGSRDGGTISGIQIEFHKPGMRDSNESVQRAAAGVATAIHQFLVIHYPTGR